MRPIGKEKEREKEKEKERKRKKEGRRVNSMKEMASQFIHSVGSFQ